MRSAVGCLLLMVVAQGCSKEPYQVAQVSGKVTLNQKPLPNAFVIFAPIGTLDKNPGPTAQGKTDAEGRYTLQFDIDGKPGTVVGKCKVYITTANPGADRPDAGGKRIKDLVPLKYNQETTLNFDVPAAGTEEANFHLKSP